MIISQLKTITERMDDFERRLEFLENSSSTKSNESPVLIDVSPSDDPQF